MAKLKPAVGYLRRSTDDKQTDSIKIQRDEVQSFADDNDYQIVRWYIDDGISGHDVDRNDFVRMIEDCETHTDFDFVIVRHQSRFARFRPATTIAYLDRIDQHGVKLVTTKQGVIDIDDLASFLMASIEAATDNKFSKTLSELTIKGQANRAGQGRSAGQSAPYGLDRVLIDDEGQQRQRVKNGEKYAKPKSWRVSFTPSDDAEAVKTVQWIFESYVYSRRGYTSIAAELNKKGIPTVRGGAWHQGTVRDLLKNPLYCGDYRWNKTRQGKFNSLTGGQNRERHDQEQGKINPRSKVARRKHTTLKNDPSDWIVKFDAHQGIISRELFQKAQEIMKEKSKNRTGGASTVQHKYLLRGLVYCSECGHKMHGSKTTRRKDGKEYVSHKYVCSGYLCKGICKHNTAKADELHKIICREIAAKFREQATIEDIKRGLENYYAVDEPEQSIDVDNIRRRLKSLANKLKVVTQRVAIVPDDLLQGVFDEMRVLKDEQDRLEQQLGDAKQASAKKSIQKLPSAEEIVQQLGKLADILESAPEDQLRELLAEALDRVELTFKVVKWGKKSVSRLSGGTIYLKKSRELRVAGTRSIQRGLPRLMVDWDFAMAA